MPISFLAFLLHTWIIGTLRELRRPCPRPNSKASEVKFSGISVLICLVSSESNRLRKVECRGEHIVDWALCRRMACTGLHGGVRSIWWCLITVNARITSPVWFHYDRVACMMFIISQSYLHRKNFWQRFYLENVAVILTENSNFWMWSYSYQILDQG